MEGFIATPKWCLVYRNGWRLYAQRDVETGTTTNTIRLSRRESKSQRMFPWAYVRARYRSDVPGFPKGELGAKCQPGAKSHAHEVEITYSHRPPSLEPRAMKAAL